MRQKTDVSSYGTFLETVKKRGSKEATASQAPMEILTILETKAQPTPMRVLISEIHKPVTYIVSAIEDLRKAQLVDVTQIDDEETVELTATGHQVVKFGQG